MSATKRRRSYSSHTSRKLPRLADEEEDMESILELIRLQEESEALAAKLQQEFDASGVTEVIDPSGDGEVVDLTGDDEDDNAPDGPSEHEDDLAIAWRLAPDWGELDANIETSTKKDNSVNIIDHGTPLPSSNLLSGSPDSPHIPARRTGTFDTHVVNPLDDLSSFRDIFVQRRDCTKCGRGVASPRNLVVFSETVPPPTLLALLHCVCGACGQSHCRGCFRRLTCSKSCKGKRCSVVDCCAEVRAIALFEALGGFDRQYLAQQGNASIANKEPSGSTPPKAATVGPGGTGYSRELPGYQFKIASRGADKNQLRNKQVAEASKVTSANWDSLNIRALDTITSLLPSPYLDGAASYDLLPHPSIRSMITLSFLPELLGHLLINDSVTDWTDRSDVYNSTLKLLRRMVDSELSVGALIDERLEKKFSVGLGDWMWANGTIEWETNPKTKEVIRVPPLIDHFKKLTKQCETFLAGASLLLENGDNDGIEDMALRATSLCGDMISAQQDMQRALSIMGRGDPVTQDVPENKGKRRDGNVDMERRYCAACEELAFKHVTLSSSSPSGGLSYLGFHYASKVQQTESSTRNPAKRLHLVRELSVISTSLPPGVWVRADEVRNDVIKIMIAGPEGTPYSGGLYEFDCFIPLEYPDVPPKMNLCTTASGNVRFNPNLYATGKVCLSLLGTWNGRPEESWSSKSTLLQVIISIQSLILVDVPYFNEPGFGPADRNSPKSKGYNKNIALQTVRWAIVDWMQKKHQEGIWADVIANHFTIRREKILQCIRAWAKDDPRFQSYSLSSMAFAGTCSAGSSYPHHRYKGAPAAAEYSRNIDLLVEIERGCELVKRWLEKP